MSKPSPKVPPPPALAADDRVGFGPWLFFQCILPLLQIFVGIVIIVLISRSPASQALTGISQSPAQTAQVAGIPAENRSIFSLFDDVVLGVFAVGLIASSLCGCWQPLSKSGVSQDVRMSIVTLLVVTIGACVLVAMSLLVPPDKIRAQWFVGFQVLLVAPALAFAWRIRT